MKNVLLTAISLLVFGCGTYHGQIIASSEDAPVPPPSISQFEDACPEVMMGKTTEEVDRAIRSCGDKSVLSWFAKYHPDVSLRVTAAKRILDIKVIIELYQYVKDDDTLTESQKGKFSDYLKKKFETLKECPGVGYSDTYKRRLAIESCNSNQLLILVARYDNDDSLRYLAATSITDVERLKELWPEIRADDTLSLDVKKDFQRGIVERAKELSAPKVPKERPPQQSTVDRRLFTEDGELIIRQPVKKEPNIPPPDPDTGNSNVETLVGTKVRAIAKNCYEMSLKKNPEIEGRIKVRVNISGNGKVSKAFLSENTTESESLEKCIVNRLKSTEFSGFKGGAKVEIPVLLISPK